MDIRLGDIDTKEKEAQLAEKIKTFLKSNKVGARKIILGLSGLHCLTRPLVLPQLPRTMLKEAIARESQRVLPIPPDQLYLSWQIISSTVDKLYAYVVAVPRDMADMIIRVVNQAGYKPYLMDIKPMALARLSKEGNAVLVDVQAQEFDIVVIADNIPQPVRTISFPQEELSTSQRFAIVKDEIKRTIQFFNKNNVDKPIQPDTAMLVSGELSAAPELYEQMANELGLKADLLVSPLKTVKQLDVLHHLVNVGLALKEITREVRPLLPNINILPTPYKPKEVSMSQLLALPAVVLAIVIIVMMVMTVQDTAAKIDALNDQVTTNNFTIEKNLAQKKVLVRSVSELQAQVAAVDSQYKMYANAYVKMSKAGDLINTDLNTTVDNVVDELALASLSHSGSLISIAGQASSEQLVLEYVRNLLSTGRFDEITIVNITRSTETDESEEEAVTYSYSLNCILKDGRP